MVVVGGGWFRESGGRGCMWENEPDRLSLATVPPGRWWLFTAAWLANPVCARLLIFLGPMAQDLFLAQP